MEQPDISVIEQGYQKEYQKYKKNFINAMFFLVENQIEYLSQKTIEKLKLIHKKTVQTIIAIQEEVDYGIINYEEAHDKTLECYISFIYELSRL